MFVSPLATFAVGKLGTRACLYIGTFLQTLALISASFATEFWQLLLSAGVCFGLGMGFLYIGIAGVSSQWFTTKRSLANGIATAGSGFGGLVYYLAADAIIQRMSLGWAFRILGILSGVVNLTSSLLIRDRNEHIGTSQVPFDYRLLRRPEVLLVQAYGFFTELGYVVLLFSLPNYANFVGLTAQQGSVLGAMLCLGNMIGRAVVGYFSDKFGPIIVTCIATFLSGLFALLIWPFATNYGVSCSDRSVHVDSLILFKVLVFYSLLIGLIVGTYWATIAPICAEVVGMQDLNAALSVSFFNLVLPITFSEAIALEINTSTGSYLGSQLFTGFMYIAGAVCLWLLKAWKVGDLERKATIEQRSKGNLDLSKTRKEEAVDEEEQKRTKSSFLKRLVVWKKV